MSIHVTDDDGVRVVEIRNPSRMNALTKPMLADLARAFDERPRETSCVVLVGDDASMSFCAGIDLRAVEDVFATDEGEIESDPVRAMEACDVPIVGAAHGACVNAGFEILLACDVVVAAQNATFVDTHAKIGILPSWGLSVKLSRAIGSNAARACSVFGEAIDATRATALGLVAGTPRASAREAREDAMALARRVKRLPGAKGIKRAINDGLDVADVRAEERRRAFANYREAARENFAAFNRARSKL